MEMSKRYRFEAMGFHAFAKGIKNACDDSEYNMAILDASPKEFEITPEDDWNQGWLIAFYKEKKENDE